MEYYHVYCLVQGLWQSQKNLGDYPACLGAGPDGALKDQETDGGEEYSSLPPPTVVRIHSAELFKNLLLYNDRTLWLIRLLTFSRIM